MNLPIDCFHFIPDHLVVPKGKSGVSVGFGLLKYLENGGHEGEDVVAEALADRTQIFVKLDVVV